MMRAACVLAVLLAAAGAPRAGERPREIYAHYMGCFPTGSGPTAHHRLNDVPKLRHDSPNRLDATGGRIYNWDLLPVKRLPLSPEDSAGLDIQRALRGGIDGFAIDAWAGGDGAKRTLDALFAYAEKNKLNFKVTLCLDPSCLPADPRDKDTNLRVNAYVEAIKYVLDRHGESPNLARRDGKPLVLTYAARGMLSGLPRTPENWDKIAEGYKAVEKAVGRPLYFHFDAGSFNAGLPPNQQSKPEKIFEWAGKNFPLVGQFLAETLDENANKALADAVKKGGGEYSHPLSHQYDNRGNDMVSPAMGFDRLRRNWQLARDTGTTLIQYVTWNDLGENTHLVPGYDTNYAFLLMNKYFIDWWKSGKAPVPTSDQVFVTFKKHPESADSFPFQPRMRRPGVLEVATLLTAPARVTLDGRGEPWDAPAGLSFKQFPVTPGKVAVSVARGGKEVLSLAAPEEITDKPFRENNSVYAISSECERQWKIDFPDDPFPAYSEYGDADGDGLPNWFEMYWFGTWLDFATATGAKPEDDPDKDGKTNLQEYLAQTNPLAAERVYVAGDVWNREQVVASRQCFNPDRDFAGRKVWTYLYRHGPHNRIPHTGLEPMAINQSDMRVPGKGTHRSPYNDPEYKSVHGWVSDEVVPPPAGEKDDPATRKWHMLFKPRLNVVVAMGWTCPVAGTYSVSGKATDSDHKGSDGTTFEISRGDKVLFSQVVKPGESAAFAIDDLALQPGDVVQFLADATPGYDADNLWVENLSVTLKALAEAKP